MRTSGEIWAYVDKEFRPALRREFNAAATALKPVLGYEEHLAWAREGVAIAQVSPLASEAAAEYFKVSVPLLSRLRFVQFAHWSRLGRGLLQLAPALAAAYYRAGPEVLGPLLIEEFELWATAGRRLFKETWRSQHLAAQFFDASPRLLRVLALEEVIALATLLDHLGRHSPDAAAQCLEHATTHFARLESRDRLPVLKLAAALAEHDAKKARQSLDEAPEVLPRLNPKQRVLFLGLLEGCAHRSPERAIALLGEGSRALAECDPTVVTPILTWAVEVAALSPAAGVEFLAVGPQLLPKLGLAQLERWLRFGIAHLVANHDAGLAYFRLHSRRAKDILRELSHLCELDGVKRVLRMYCKALAGRDLQVQPTAELVGKGIGWTHVEQATSDGSAIFLPPVAEDFATREENFAYYKVLATHQTGHLEFGTYDFVCDRPAALFESRRLDQTAASPPGEAIGELERFFDRFSDRKLAKQLFAVLEDGRVDALILDEYGGIRRFYRAVQRRALQQRPPLFSLPLRQACVDFLLRLSLGFAAEGAILRVPPGLGGLVRYATAVTRRLWRPGARVEDSAEATLRLYDLLSAVPNILVALSGAWQDVDLGGVLRDDDAAAEAALRELQLLADALLAAEVPFELIAEADYRGEMKPELVQALMKVRQSGADPDAPGTPISPEELKRLLEKNADIEITSLEEGDVDASLGLFVSNLLREKGKAVAARKKKSQKERRSEQQAELPGNPDTVELGTFYYDEWDFRADDYRPRWCQLTEHRLREGELSFYQETLRKHAALANTVRKQFELLRPELFKKIKRLEDGEEFDLDALIEAVIDRRSGHTPSEKIYWRRNKVQRDVCVAFLLDMSASTDEEIEEKRRNPWDEDAPRGRGMRIVDLEKESLVLLTQALQAIGDRYGIYGFSGYGRDNCECYVVKDLREDFGDRVKRRIDKITPMRGTRMGAAIRHITAKLEAEDARLRILVLLSDGYPQDHDYYGAHRSEKDYALHDTKMALLEAKRKNILPFCLTIDKTGHDYLKTMCADIEYEIVNDVHALPRRLPALYRALTT